MSHFLGFTVRERNDIFVKIANNSFFKRMAKKFLKSPSFVVLL